ncbi:hypothetical protein [Thalassomonas haliotis]|uniref:Uncharacterized protein n=1 Tax=Thalassomonas haliotis TaxID=485448 RepID=A0ABY7VBF9_9GAMM|nr:hypothetical protein [Thalassomonas haliotis]WDE10238.1 hypothetical protein H3N35_18400 [Thalassomonas haliotis]
MSTEETIVYGVIAGILTSFIIFFLLQVFNNIIAPWYKSFIYQGLDINGVWEEINEHEGAKDISKISLTQHAQQIKGFMTVVKYHNDTEETEIKNFKMKGFFRDGHVILTGENSNKKYRGHITYLLSITEGGNSLSGILSWVDSGSDKIESSETVLHRENV